MEEKTIIVTGIGGNVGQGVLRNARSLNRGIRIIGTDISDFSAGSHLCDAAYKVPYSYESSYIPRMQEIAAKENADLIFPTTDYEVYFLSLNKNSFNAVVAASNADVAKIYLDKYLTFQQHKKLNIPFAQSWLPGEYDDSCKEIILKPREGRGSRGIVINPSNPKTFGDDYMVQPLYKGKEITTAFYVKIDGNLHGLLTMERELGNGATLKSKVVREYDSRLKKIINKMISQGGLHASVNLQSIVTDENEIIPFEVNCRISGTNSIRSNFGFEDVKYTLQEYLFNEEPSKPAITDGVAVRILMDVIYPNQKDFESCSDNKTQFHLF